MPRVLVVDDDDTVADVVVSYLERAGHETQRLADGDAALAAVAHSPPDLVVLDLMLPGVGGLEICRQIRLTDPHLPLIMLTALGEAEDRIAGLQFGADDYVTKPFSPRELVLRVDSVLRRSAGPPARSAVLSAGPITVDPVARRATRDGVELTLTVLELDLLIFLLEHPGAAFTREQLMSNVWGWTVGDQSTVTVHVRRLREKIEIDPAHPRIVQTVWGVGYRLEMPCMSQP
jgi:two-component system, OmpR family, response regulator ResD